jgi:hypothetical protein
MVVQGAGWYFKPVRMVLAHSANRLSRTSQRLPLSGREYVVTKAVIPTNTVAPVASGTAQDGQTLSSTNGTWTGTATVTVGSGYQWQTATDVGFMAAATTADGVNALDSATVNVVSTAGFPAAGTFDLGGVPTTYTGVSATSFTGCGNHAATVGGEDIAIYVLDIGGATASTYLLTASEIGLYARCIVMSVNVAAIGLGYSNALGPVIA